MNGKVEANVENESVVFVVGSFACELAGRKDRSWNLVEVKNYAIERVSALKIFWFKML